MGRASLGQPAAGPGLRARGVSALRMQAVRPGCQMSAAPTALTMSSSQCVTEPTGLHILVLCLPRLPSQICIFFQMPRPHSGAGRVPGQECV